MSYTLRELIPDMRIAEAYDSAGMKNSRSTLGASLDASPGLTACFASLARCQRLMDD